MEQVIVEKTELKSNLLTKLDAIENSINRIKEEYRLLRNIPVGGLQQLGTLQKFDKSIYDAYADLGNEMFSKLVQEYRSAAAEFNQHLDKKIEYARKFIIEQNRKEVKRLEQRVIEAQRDAAQQARNVAEAKRQLVCERKTAEIQLKDAEQRVRNLESYLVEHKELKQVYERIAKQIDYLGNELNSIEYAHVEYNKKLQDTLSSGFMELKKQFEDVKKNIQEKTLTNILEKLVDLYELFGCYNNQLHGEGKTQEMVADVGKKIEFYGKKHEGLTNEISARAVEETERYKQRIEEGIGAFEKHFPNYTSGVKNPKREQIIIRDKSKDEIKMAIKRKWKNESPYLVVEQGIPVAAKSSRASTLRFKVLGDILSGNYSWTARIDMFRRTLSSMKTYYNITPNERQYLINLYNLLNREYLSGALGRITKRSTQKSEAIQETLHQFNSFIERIRGYAA